MATKKKTALKKDAAKAAPKKKSAASAKETSAKAAKAKTRVQKTAAKSAAAAEKTATRATATKKTAEKSKKALAKTRKRAVKVEEEAGYQIGEAVPDPIGDVSSGEARTYLGEVEAPGQAEMEAYRAETETAALAGTLEAKEEMKVAAEAASEAGAEDEDAGAAQPPAKLERLQKILSQAGIASRRRAEEMIVAGRVMVNGQVVTQLGSKADPTRDHIRVDGRLLHGAERHRYFVLNKPRGYVTTVTDPEGRPTVMQFFAKMHERLYPVGRLDYQSEGLLLMTNDGELANLLTKAGSGVEKTYVVKVAGQPSEEQLERLRGGVAIEKGEASSERVRTAPAQIRQVRAGENPWYEVVLTEGRNRELRKMFAAVGHFAEKIRRVGYGPLALDVEPGKLRELTADEVNALRMTAEGKMQPRRVNVDRMLPREAGKAAERWDKTAQRHEKPVDRGGRPFRRKGEQQRKKDWRPREREFGKGEERGSFRQGEKGGFTKRPGAPFGAKPRFGRPAFHGRERSEQTGRGFKGTKRGPFQPRGEQPEFRSTEKGRRPFRERGERPSFEQGKRPDWKRSGEGKRRFEGGQGKGFGKGAKFGGTAGGFAKPRSERQRGRKSGFSRPGAQRGGWKRRG